MLPTSFHYFSTPSGHRLLDEASTLTDDTLKAVERLRADYPIEYVREAVELTQLRQRAAGKFSLAERMWFDRIGLEQASGEEIAGHRAKRFTGCDSIAELCCGIGGDTAALALIADTVIAVDREATRATAARWNARVHGLGEAVRPVVADLETWLPPAEAAFYDPDRRAQGHRRYAYAEYRPSLALADLTDRYPQLGVKVAPGIPEADIPDDCEVEFISERGVCKEAVLWFGGLRSGARRRATLLPGDHTLVDESAPAPAVQMPGAYLYEPDAAVVRSHLIPELAEQFGAWLICPQVAYLSSDTRLESPFAASFRVIDTFHFSLKRLQAYIRQHSIGQLTIKKRRFPLTPEDLRSRLKLKGDTSATLICTRVDGAPTVIVGEPLAHEEIKGVDAPN